MTDEEKESRIKQVLCDMVMLKETGLQPGTMFRIVRKLEKISPEVFARTLGITAAELHDIEECRKPFPTIFLMSIFVYGLPEWNQAKECDADDDDAE